MSAAAGPSRAKRNAIPEEDARLLKFGSLAEADALTPAEVQNLIQQMRHGTGKPPLPDNKSTLDHIAEFGTLSSESVSSIRNALDIHNVFNSFEKAQLIYLRPESVEVAVSLIPSLERFKDTDDEAKLQDILAEVRNLARYGAQP